MNSVHLVKQNSNLSLKTNGWSFVSSTYERRRRNLTLKLMDLMTTLSAREVKVGLCARFS